MCRRCLTFENPKTWFKALPWAEYWYNIAFHTSAGITPFKALYGRDPPSLTRYTVNTADPLDLQEQLRHRDAFLIQLKANLLKAQQHMKDQADKKRKHVEFQVGDSVLVKLQPYRQSSAALRKHQKLGLCFFGPFSKLAM